MRSCSACRVCFSRNIIFVPRGLSYWFFKSGVRWRIVLMKWRKKLGCCGIVPTSDVVDGIV